MESETGPQEFFFIPAELIPLLPPMEDISLTPPLSQTVAPVEIDAADVCLATSILIDDAVTLLAAVQRCPGRALTPDTLGPYLHLPSFDFLLALLTDLQFITPEFKLDPERVKTFLQAPRAEQLRALAEAWRSSKTWNDLLHIPTLSPEPGAWLNDPAAARSFLVRFCATLPAGERSERSEWRSLDSFVACVREQHPDFQRPAGNYDSWYIRDDASGDYLRGFENWDRVDGALIRYLLTGPMYWLGLVDLRGAPDAFRLSAIFSAFAAESPWQIAEKPKPIIAKHDGALLVARNVNRYDRFQAARIGEWVAPRVGAGGSPAPTPRVPDYEYRLTGNSLQAAAAQGITAKHVTSFLRRACEHAPQHIIDLVERWGRNGIEARVSHLMVIKLNNPDVLETLMRSPRTRRWLGEAIGDCAAEVKDWEKLREAMAEIGLAAEFIKR